MLTEFDCGGLGGAGCGIRQCYDAVDVAEGVAAHVAVDVRQCKDRCGLGAALLRDGAVACEGVYGAVLCGQAGDGGAGGVDVGVGGAVVCTRYAQGVDCTGCGLAHYLTVNAVAVLGGVGEVVAVTYCPVAVGVDNREGVAEVGGDFVAAGVVDTDCSGIAGLQGVGGAVR